MKWFGGTGGGASKNRWGRKHDTLLFYSKGETWTFNMDAVREPHKWDQGQKRADGSPRSLAEGKIADDVFKHHAVMPWAKERTGWPTQKPLALLERIIKASSNEGDFILDPFCGCGTSVVAAENMFRKWVGMDISPLALDIVNHQLARLANTKADMVGYPTSLARAKALAASDWQRFERWAASRIPGIVPNIKQVGDGGKDGTGITYGDKNAVVVQVKGGGYTIDNIRAFRSVVSDVERKGKSKARAYGVFITQDKVTARSHLNEFAKAGRVPMGATDFPALQFWSMEEYFAGKAPNLPPLAEPKSKGRKSLEQNLLW